AVTSLSRPLGDGQTECLTGLDVKGSAISPRWDCHGIRDRALRTKAQCLHRWRGQWRDGRAPPRGGGDSHDPSWRPTRLPAEVATATGTTSIEPMEIEFEEA